MAHLTFSPLPRGRRFVAMLGRETSSPKGRHAVDEARGGGLANAWW